MKSFNQLLIERIQEYFKKKKGILISEEKAEEYLHSMADLYEIFRDLSGGTSDPPETP